MVITTTARFFEEFSIFECHAIHYNGFGFIETSEERENGKSAELRERLAIDRPKITLNLKKI